MYKSPLSVSTKKIYAADAAEWRNKMTLTEKTAYIKGLCDGLQLDATTPEAKIINALVDLVNDMAAEIAELEEDVANVYEYCDELDEDLGAVEEYLIDELSDDECEYGCGCDCGCDCDCDCDDDEEFFEIICPSCGETVCFDESVNAEDLICPACQSEIGCIVDDDDIDPVED